MRKILILKLSKIEGFYGRTSQVRDTPYRVKIPQVSLSPKPSKGQFEIRDQKSGNLPARNERNVGVFHDRLRSKKKAA